MKISSLVLAVALGAAAFGCDKGKAGDTAGAASAAASAAAATGAGASAAPPAKAATAAVKPAEPASAAAAFPATALPTKNMADYTIGLPPGGKLEKNGTDKSVVETPDYKIIIKVAKKDETAEMKGQIPQMPGFKALTVDSPDGLVAEVEEKGKTEYVFTRYVKVGDVLLSCENTLTKPPKDKAKAQEAFDVCGTIKKK
jgi:hypothetical protein